MTDCDFAAMRGEHRQAMYEHLKWLDDIERWRAEHRQAAATLAAAQADLVEAKHALESHAERIGRHDMLNRRHERAITQHLSDASGIEMEKLVSRHRQLEAEHARAREVHEIVKAHHRRVMAQI
jgi:hypothetical protein